MNIGHNDIAAVIASTVPAGPLRYPEHSIFGVDGPRNVERRGMLGCRQVANAAVPMPLCRRARHSLHRCYLYVRQSFGGASLASQDSGHRTYYVLT